jgi:hypothetical protein
MKIKNIEVTYLIEYIEKRIHVLDLSNSNYGGLQNVIGPDFQKELIEKEHLLIDVMDFDWVLYCSGGLVMTYKGYNLNLVSKTEKWLHAPFLSRIQG